MISSKIIKKKRLYGFDGGKYYKFIKLEFENVQALNKVKNFWYTGYKKDDKGNKKSKNYKGWSDYIKNNPEKMT